MAEVKCVEEPKNRKKFISKRKSFGLENEVKKHSETDNKRKKVKTPRPIDDEKLNNAVCKEKPVLKIDFRRIIFKCLVIISFIFAVSLTQHDLVETFASQQEEIKSRTATVLCSQDYKEELDNFPECVPRTCGRYLSDTVVSQGDVRELMRIAVNGLSLGGSLGGASILDLHSGALSRGDSFVNIYSIDKMHKVITAEDLNIYKRVKNKIKSVVEKHFGVDPKYLHLTHPTFFSHMTALPARTVHDEYWHPHVDKETYKSFHYTSLLYLTDYKIDFKGGRFIFVDKDTNRTVEPRTGRLSAFTSGPENLHFVERVTSGSRYAITVSFTCDPAQAIKDPQLM